MGQFKPMVKMMTTEPSVELKLKKGGHVAKKAYGGAMAMPSSMPTMPARGGALPGASPMAPSMMARRKAMAAPLLMSKKGGKADDKAQDKAMIKKAFKQHDMQEHKGAKGTKLKLKNGGMYSEGGKIDSAETKTTIKGNAGKYVNTKVVDGDKKDTAHGTGAVKMGKPAGFKNGGAIEGNAKKFLNKVVDGDKKDTAHGTGGVKMGNGGGFKSGGSTNWENRPADTAKPGVSNTKTGEVKEANAGGYKKGGAAKKHFATGGSVNDTGHAVAMPRKPVSASVKNTMQSGTFKKGGSVEKEEKPNLRLLKTHTGPKGHMAKVYKDKDWGEHRVKFFSPEGKHMSDSDYHTDDMSDANDTAKGQLGRFKKGGKVVRKAYGGSMDDQQMPMRDMSGGDYGRSMGPSESDMDIANSIRNAPGTAMSAMMRLLGKRPATGAGAGRGMVNPPMARKKGGSAKC